MDSLQASYRDDEDEAQAQLDLTKQQPEPVLVVNSRNEAAQESESQLNSVAPEPPKPSSPKGDVGKEPESLNGHTHEDRDEPKVEPMETDCCVSKSAAQEPSSITEDAATQESEPQNDTVQAQREHTEPDSISERAVQEQDSVNDAAPEAQREFVVSDSISSDDAALESEPQNDGGAQEARPQAMVTDPVSDKDAETPLEAHTSTQPEPMASESFSEDDPTASDDTQKSSKLVNTAAQNDDLEEEEDEDGDRPPKKQRPLSLLTNLHEQQPHEQEKQIPVANNNSTAKAITKPSTGTATKKSKKKSFSVWVSRTTRKGKKKNKTNAQKEVSPEDTVLITPVPRFPDKGDDNPEMKICLSKVYKAEKVELSEDRLTAGSTKGYRMVRATRGVVEGAWYYEIKVVALGATGHTRLGWSTEKGDLQAPVGYDGNSYGYRDIDGSKVHKALREKYGEEGYKEGDVIGFYINLPDGGQYAPKPPHYVWYKGQRYVCAPDAKEDQPKVIPGSEISFYKNGVCQGVAFKDLNGGRYHAAASMYTLPNQPNCVVKFNFGPGFECFPEDFGARPAPSPMIEVPYHGVDSRNENGESNEKNQ